MTLLAAAALLLALFAVAVLMRLLALASTHEFALQLLRRIGEAATAPF